MNPCVTVQTLRVLTPGERQVLMEALAMLAENDQFGGAPRESRHIAKAMLAQRMPERMFWSPLV